MNNDEKSKLPKAEESLPQTLGFGKGDALAEVVAKAKETAVEAAREIQASTGQPIERRDALRIVSAFRSTLVPHGRRGRKQKAVITAAHADYKGGMRGVALYRKHIPRFTSMSHWEREVEARRLMDAIRSRERRARVN
jgi:hypothetical protein